MDQGVGPGQRRPPTEADPTLCSQLSDRQGPEVGEEGEGSQAWFPQKSAPSPPFSSVVHNPGRPFKEFSTRVLVIYLDSLILPPTAWRAMGPHSPNPQPRPRGHFHL
jgi:hypothetical protein